MKTDLLGEETDTLSSSASDAAPLMLAPPTDRPLVTDDDEEVTRVEVNEAAAQSAASLDDPLAITSPPTLSRSTHLPAPSISPWPRVEALPPGAPYRPRVAPPGAPTPARIPVPSAPVPLPIEPAPAVATPAPADLPRARWPVALATGLLGFAVGGLLFGTHAAGFLSTIMGLAHPTLVTSADPVTHPVPQPLPVPLPLPSKSALPTPPQALDRTAAAPSTAAPVAPVRNRPRKAIKLDEVVLTVTDSP